MDVLADAIEGLFSGISGITELVANITSNLSGAIAGLFSFINFCIDEISVLFNGGNILVALFLLLLMFKVIRVIKM